MKSSKTWLKAGLSVAALSVLAACATKSHVTREGTTDNPIFPDPSSVTFTNERGTFPTSLQLAAVKSGVTEDQLYTLLGRPHFDEGMFFVREWDYLFHFHTPGQGTDNITTCQFKVVFDKDKLGRSFFWRAVDPVDAVCPPAAPVAPALPLAPQSKTHRLTLGADALFYFDKSSQSDMLPEGFAKLDKFAADIKRFSKVDSIRIIGYTDRKGGHDYNIALSQRRAETVRRYLVSRGVPAGIMSAQGLGKANPVQECSTKLPRTQEIACLQPNRRVEIEVDGIGELTN